MATNQDLVWICERVLQNVAEVRAHAQKLMQLENDIKVGQQTLNGLNGQIAEAKRLSQQLPEVEQQLRTKRAELASLEAQVAAKHVSHGEIEGKLRD
jgi:chromosome segregation ATPase